MITINFALWSFVGNDYKGTLKSETNDWNQENSCSAGVFLGILLVGYGVYIDMT